MKTILKGAALSLSLLAAAVAASVPASAQTQQHHRAVRAAPAPALPYGAHYGPDGTIYSSMGSAIPGYVLSQPNECWMEDGYSHWTTCDTQ